MLTSHTPETLKAFEQEIAEAFNAGKIRAPVHLDGGSEEQLISIFQGVEASDWICGSWRQHYHCLLKGVPPEELKAEIMAGRSISLCFPQYRIMSSAIVGGIIPIALGLAMQGHRVWCFLGDMTALTGISAECMRYAAGHGLPIMWIVEGNGKSVCTDTKEVWGGSNFPAFIDRFSYELPWPHAGAGQRVQF